VGVSSSTYLNNYRSINSVDYTLSDKDSIRARYLYNKSVGPDTAATFQSFWSTAPSLFHLGLYFVAVEKLEHFDNGVAA